MTHQDWIDQWKDHLREEGCPPASVWKFCKQVGATEEDFFAEFSSLDAVESAFWSGMVERVVAAVTTSADWPGFNARQRALTFLFAFCDAALAERSIFLLRFAHVRPTDRLVWFRDAEGRFLDFFDAVLEHGRASGEIACRGNLNTLYPRMFLFHFRAVIAFHVADTSRAFERTDAFIEKSVAVAFDVIRTQAIDSAVDLFRFLTQRAHEERGG